MKWTKIDSRVETFLEEEEAVSITIIKTGFEDCYLVVYDDSLHYQTGECHEMKKAEIELRYGIELQI